MLAMGTWQYREAWQRAYHHDSERQKESLQMHEEGEGGGHSLPWCTCKQEEGRGQH